MLDGDPAPPLKGHCPHRNFQPMSVVAKQDATWYRGRPQPKGLYVVGTQPPPAPKKEAEPPIFDPCLLWPNGWTDQDGTWHEGRPWSSRHCARWRHSSPPQRGIAPQFSTHIYCGQMAGWIQMPLDTEVGLGPGHIVLDGDPAHCPPPQRRGHSPQFLANVYCGKTAGWIKMPLGMDVGRGPGHIVLDGAQLPPQKKGAQPPIFGPCLLWPNGRPPQLRLSTCRL